MILLSNQGTLEVDFQQKVVPNVECMVVEDMEANQKTDLLLGTNYGLMASYRLHPRHSPDQPLWHPLKTWNLVYPIKNLLFMRVDMSSLLLITLGEGSVLILQFPNQDNPERASPKNLESNLDFFAN